MTENAAVKKSDTQQILLKMQILERKVLFAQIKLGLVEEIFANVTNDWLSNSLFMKTHGTKIFTPTKVNFEIRNRLSELFDARVDPPKISTTRNNPFLTIFRYRLLSTTSSFRPILTIESYRMTHSICGQED